MERGRRARARRGHVNGINFDMMGAEGMNFEWDRRPGSSPWSPPMAAPVSSPTASLPQRHGDHARRPTLLVAESFASRVTAFDIDDDYGLSNRRIWGEIEGGADGVSLDADGALWCAAQGGASL